MEELNPDYVTWLSATPREKRESLIFCVIDQIEKLCIGRKRVEEAFYQLSKQKTTVALRHLLHKDKKRKTESEKTESKQKIKGIRQEKKDSYNEKKTENESEVRINRQEKKDSYKEKKPENEPEVRINRQEKKDSYKKKKPKTEPEVRRNSRENKDHKEKHTKNKEKKTEDESEIRRNRQDKKDSYKEKKTENESEVGINKIDHRVGYEKNVTSNIINETNEESPLVGLLTTSSDVKPPVTENLVPEWPKTGFDYQPSLETKEEILSVLTISSNVKPPVTKNLVPEWPTTGFDNQPSLETKKERPLVLPTLSDVKPPVTKNLVPKWPTTGFDNQPSLETKEERPEVLTTSSDVKPPVTKNLVPERSSLKTELIFSERKLVKSQFNPADVESKEGFELKYITVDKKKHHFTQYQNQTQLPHTKIEKFINIKSSRTNYLAGGKIQIPTQQQLDRNYCYYKNNLKLLLKEEDQWLVIINKYNDFCHQSQSSRSDETASMSTVLNKANQSSRLSVASMSTVFNRAIRPAYGHSVASMSTVTNQARCLENRRGNRFLHPYSMRPSMNRARHYPDYRIHENNRYCDSYPSRGKYF